VDYRQISSTAFNGSNIAGSGVKYTANYSWYNTNNAQLTNLLASGNEYSQAYKSSQKLKQHSFHTLISSSYLTTEIQNLITSGVKYTWAYQSVKDSGNEIYASYKHSSNASLHSFTVGSYITSSNAISRFADSGNVRSRFPASSTAISKYADSGNVRYRFQSSSLSYASYKHSANTSLHNFTTTNLTIASVSSMGKISGQWQVPLYTNLTNAGNASTRPGQLIRTSGNSSGTWVWVSIYGGSNYQWMQLTYLTGA
jgi:hypothetical protein